MPNGRANVHSMQVRSKGALVLNLVCRVKRTIERLKDRCEGERYTRDSLLIHMEMDFRLIQSSTAQCVFIGPSGLTPSELPLRFPRRQSGRETTSCHPEGTSGGRSVCSPVAIPHGARDRNGGEPGSTGEWKRALTWQVQPQQRSS